MSSHTPMRSREELATGFYACETPEERKAFVATVSPDEVGRMVDDNLERLQRSIAIGGTAIAEDAPMLSLNHPEEWPTDGQTTET